MAVEKAEESFLNERCRCCFVVSTSRDLWAQYICDGKVEVYGEMLADCFGLTLQQPEEHREQICESCVERLRTAVSFKQDVITTTRLFQEMGDRAESKLDAKEFDYNVQVQHMEDQSQDNDEETNAANVKGQEEEVEEYILIQADKEESELENEDSDVDYNPEQESGEEYHDQDSMSLGSPPAGQYCEVEFLEDDEDAKKAQTSEVAKGKRKKKGKKVYKQYSEQNLREAVKAVMCGRLTRTEASVYYQVPGKTISARVRKLQDSGTNDEEDQETTNTAQFGLINEIQTILVHTSATPYRSKGGKYYCVYCSTESPHFEDPQELRVHTRTQHAAERIRGIDVFMRPAYKNEILKLDIQNLHCLICLTEIESWNAMFFHLKEKHNVDLNEAYSKVIPYILTDDLSCCLCKEKFPTYFKLDIHMNAHYNNYICGQCGEAFLAKARLVKHAETHEHSKFKCEYCGKIFSLDRYRHKHVKFVHHKAQNSFKCNYCEETFTGNYARHVHCVNEHSEKIKTINCELCDREFSWRPYFLKHMRLKHNKEMRKKHKCKECDKSFLMKHQLRNHEKWHRGDHKQTCIICDRSFASGQYLKKHYATHIAELDPTTSHTGQTFTIITSQ